MGSPAARTNFGILRAIETLPFGARHFQGCGRGMPTIIVVADAKYRNMFRTLLPIPSYVLAPQKSGLSARGTSASFPGYHWMFSAQACSAQSAGPLPPLP